MNQKRVAIVTGASRGIGRAVVERLSADGYHLVLGYGRDHAAAASIADAVRRAGTAAIAVPADVADPVAVAALFDKAEEVHGGVDVVVHAAARQTLAPLVDFDLDELQGLLQVNVFGTFVVAQQAARRLRAGGAIVAFSSAVIGRALPRFTAYAGSKAAVEAMVFTLAHELRGRDVTVNAVAPGPTATEMFLADKTSEQIDFFAQGSPLHRLGTPVDIAEVVAFLASPAGHWVNGQTLRVNGGVN